MGNLRQNLKLRANYVNDIYNKRIKEIGKEKFLKELKEKIKKDNILNIKNSYNNLKKDLKNAPFCGMKDIQTTSLINTIKGNQENLPIFEIEDDNEEYKIKFPTIPFKSFYIATNICEEINKEIYTIGGFFVLDYDNDSLCVIFCWSRMIGDGWAFSSFLVNKNGLLKPGDLKCVDPLGIVNEGKDKKEILNMAGKKFKNLMKKLIYKINRKEYTTYKKYSYGNYTEKEIVFAYDVRSHMRHFWKDSGKFKIPLMTKEAWEKKGYRTHELVVKDNQLRRDVPFKMIAEFKVDGVKVEENKVYDLIEKRIFRQEHKLGIILQELFPTQFIKKHDRKKLKGLELDFWIHKLNLAFEYDGEQHFDRELCEDVFKSDFDALQKRDKKKNHLCRNKNITLIRIKYDEPLNKTHIKKKLKEAGKWQ
ncbi:MAG TPA: hypothetical protein VMZ91_08120 [Candidatus Paceibacterota bacterium]|nr:hypothetical protein [Candidatus Paceibacterota bacterium]